jgi:hypothetical protein
LFTASAFFAAFTTLHIFGFKIKKVIGLGHRLFEQCW